MKHLPLERLVIASNNANKLREIRSLLSGLKISLQSQKEFHVTGVTETGLTFVENAILKARNACLHSGLPAISDDSGIEVDALDGAPGVHSADYAGVGATDAANRNKLLGELAQTPADERTARFQCVVVLLHHSADPMPLVCHGTWEGQLLTEPRGKHGFGYDPIFYVPTHDCSAAELELREKNRLSHRGQALGALIKILQQRAAGVQASI